MLLLYFQPRGQPRGIVYTPPYVFVLSNINKRCRTHEACIATDCNKRNGSRSMKFRVRDCSRAVRVRHQSTQSDHGSLASDLALAYLVKH